MRLLFGFGANPNGCGNTPLVTAFSHRQAPVFRELLRAGADTTLRDQGDCSIADDIRRRGKGTRVAERRIPETKK